MVSGVALIRLEIIGVIDPWASVVPIATVRAGEICTEAMMLLMRTARP
jgi:hypothetical protein